MGYPATAAHSAGRVPTEEGYRHLRRADGQPGRPARVDSADHLPSVLSNPADVEQWMTLARLGAGAPVAGRVGRHCALSRTGALQARRVDLYAGTAGADDPRDDRWGGQSAEF